MARRVKSGAKCKHGTVIIKKKSGKIVAKFQGHHGSGCKHRTFRKGVTPAALRPFAAAAKQCAKSHKVGTRDMGKCIVRSAMKSRSSAAAARASARRASK